MHGGRTGGHHNDVGDSETCKRQRVDEGKAEDTFQGSPERGFKR